MPVGLSVHKSSQAFQSVLNANLVEYYNKHQAVINEIRTISLNSKLDATLDVRRWGGGGGGGR